MTAHDFAATSAVTTASELRCARDFALKYAGLGWFVFPCGQDKKPLTEHGFLDATTEQAVIEAWWTTWPNAQIGVACGASKLVAIDLDVGKDKNGIEAFDAFLGISPHGSNLVAMTPRQGRHHIYADPTNAYGCAQSAASLQGIDVRGDGGYIIVPSGVAGREWIDDSGLEGVLAAVPDHVLPLLPPRRGSTGPRSKGKMAPAGTATDERFAEVRAALFAIKPSVKRLAGWLQAIFGVHAALDADERGAELVEEWSSGTDVPGQYEEGEPWGTYAVAVLPWKVPPNHRQLIDKETLFAMAIQCGWTWTGEDRADAALQAAINNAPSPADRPTVVDDQPEPFPSTLIEGGDLVSTMVRHIVDTAVVPQPAFALGTVLATLGAVLGRCVQIRGGGGSPARTNIYILNIGDTSSGKNHPRTQCPVLLAKAGMADLIGPREYMSGSSVFATLQSHPAHVAYIDEFGLILQATTGKQAPPHLRAIATALLTLFSSASGRVEGAAYANQRERPMEPITEPCLSLAGFSTPETLIGALSSKNIADGLLGRCLMFPADTSAKKRRGLYHRKAAEAAGAISIDRVVHELAKLRKAVAPHVLPDMGGEAGRRCRDVYWSEDAADYIDRTLLSREEERRAIPRFGGLWARLTEQVSKVALVRAIATNPGCEEIDLPHLLWAEKLVTWCMSRLERLLREHLADSPFEADTLRALQIIRAARDKGLTGSELTRKIRWLKGTERKDVVGTLVETGHVVTKDIRSDRPDGKGKPKVIHYAAEFAPK